MNLATILSFGFLILGFVMLAVGLLILRIVRNSKQTPQPFTISKNVTDPSIIEEHNCEQTRYYRDLLR